MNIIPFALQCHPAKAFVNALSDFHINCWLADPEYIAGAKLWGRTNLG